MGITVEIQAMAYLLSIYGVTFCEGGFCYQYVRLHMPMCIELQDIIISKLIENKKDLNDDSIKFNERAEKYINAIGSVVRNLILGSENEIENLIKIMDILYVKQYDYSDETVMQITQCTREDLQKAQELVEYIERILNGKEPKKTDELDRTTVEKNVN